MLTNVKKMSGLDTSLNIYSLAVSLPAEEFFFLADEAPFVVARLIVESPS